PFASRSVDRGLRHTAFAYRPRPDRALDRSPARKRPRKANKLGQLRRGVATFFTPGLRCDLDQRFPAGVAASALLYFFTLAASIASGQDTTHDTVQQISCKRISLRPSSSSLVSAAYPTRITPFAVGARVANPSGYYADHARGGEGASARGISTRR